VHFGVGYLGNSQPTAADAVDAADDGAPDGALGATGDDPDDEQADIKTCVKMRQHTASRWESRGDENHRRVIWLGAVPFISRLWSLISSNVRSP
jgi:hypothetical protein